MSVVQPPVSAPGLHGDDTPLDKAWLDHHTEVAKLLSDAAPAKQPALAAPVKVDGAAATDRMMQFTTDGVVNWDIGASSAPQTSLGGGSDLVLRRYSNLGDLVATILSIARDTGEVNIQAMVLFSGPVRLDGTVGFHGVVPQPQQIVSGSAKSGAAAASLATALATIGLIENRTTP